MIIDFIKKNYRLIIVFIVSFLIYNVLGFYINNGDPIASYGFAHAIKNGEVIYKDFNTIATPLYALYCSLFLYLYDDFIMFVFAQSILVTVMFYFLFKLFDNNSWLVFLSMIILKFMGFNATYNFCCFAMTVIFLYFECKHNNKDFLIGGLIGLIFLSKQTVGGVFFLISLLIYIKNYKKNLKRTIGFLIPCFFVGCYLLIIGAMNNFIDLCFLGLFDFGSNNNNIFTFWFFTSIILLIINIFLYFKDRRKVYFYGLGYLSFVLPIFDICHFAFYFSGFIVILLFYLKEISSMKRIIIYAIIVEFLIFNTLMGYRVDKVKLDTKNNHFKYKIYYQQDYNNCRNYDLFIDKYIEHNPILVMYYSMSYNISHDRSISYFDVFLFGNYGYNGNKKMKKRIKNMHNQYFIINMNEYYNSFDSDSSQFNYDVADYIILKSKKIECCKNVCVYYKK